MYTYLSKSWLQFHKKRNNLFTLIVEYRQNIILPPLIYIHIYSEFTVSIHILKYCLQRQTAKIYYLLGVYTLISFVGATTFLVTSFRIISSDFLRLWFNRQKFLPHLRFLFGMFKVKTNFRNN